ncbi:FAS1-like dehydratase domain-containing protein [Halostella litorea]|uniref:FAS1-like dehydratase domain-containing protein n=1 Tax=Halostella litorea TaxID=2528831 RepID=UPI0010922000|nr:MaoC family dehydratase N-terminal domain-containing protein [Halostella litorea]
MEEPKQGRTITYERTFTVEEVQQFASLSGDDQPRHVEPDDDGRVMVQGLLTATMPTKLGGDHEVLATEMEFEFHQPVYTGERVVCYATYETVVERDDRFELTWDVTCENEAEDVVLDAMIYGLIWKDN